MRRLPQADDVARMVEHLLGDGGRDITGSVLTTDAGNTRELDSFSYRHDPGGTSL